MKIIKKIHNKYLSMNLAARAALWFMISSLIQKGIITITTPFFSRILTQEEYGIVSIYNSWMSIFTLLGTFALTTGVLGKAMIKYREKRWEYLSSILVLISIIMPIFWVLVFASRFFFPNLVELDYSLIAIMGIDILFTSALALWTNKNRFEFNYRPIVLVTISSNFLGTLFSLFLVILFPENRVFFRIFGSVVVHLIMYAPIYRFIIRKGKKFYVPEYWKYSLQYNAPLIPHYLSQQVLNQSDRIMISSMTGNVDAAIYSMAYQIAIAIRIVVDSIFSSFDPWCFQHMENEDYKPIGKRACQIELLVGFLCLGFSLFAPEMILVMGGNAYVSSAYVIPPVAMSVLFIAVYSMFSSIEFYFEETKLVMIASCIVAGLNILSNWIFIKLYGFIAAAYTTLGCYIVYALLHYFFMCYVCKKNNIINPFPFTKVWIPAITFAILSVSIISLYSFKMMRYFVIALLFCLSGYTYLRHFRKK